MTKITSPALLNKASKPITQLHTTGHTPGKKKTHQIRVCIKRLLARLHLLEKVTATDPNISNLSQSLKQLSCHLAKTRDRDVMVALLEQLTTKANTTSINNLLKQTRRRLLGAEQQPITKLKVLQNLATGIHTDLHLIPHSGISLGQIQHYLQKRWQRICDQYKAILREQYPQKMHKLRRKIKWLCYQYELLDELEPSSWLPTKKLAKLGTKLGKVHDFFVLESYLCHQQQLSAKNIQNYDSVYNLLSNKRKHLLEQCRKAFKHACRSH
ncbi:MAG: CHAD domain-containing protein [Paraglaciecola sp.]|jgi:CHAD domain-containing protein